MITKPRLLDLFCGEGGASMGYSRAGFDVFGVDQSRTALRRYPFDSYRGDAVAYAHEHGHEFDVIHASPPCKVHNSLRHLRGEDLGSMLFPIPKHSNLIPATRDALVASGQPWVIENVPLAAAHMRLPTVVCGTTFRLGVDCEDGRYRRLWRHRLFESNMRLSAADPCIHDGEPVGVYGQGGGIGKTDSNRRRGYQASLSEARIAMGTPWMSRNGVSQAIPPAYTEFIGRQLLAATCGVGKL